jgi:hypothetical protein
MPWSANVGLVVAFKNTTPCVIWKATSDGTP